MTGMVAGRTFIVRFLIHRAQGKMRKRNKKRKWLSKPMILLPKYSEVFNSPHNLKQNLNRTLFSKNNWCHKIQKNLRTNKMKMMASETLMKQTINRAVIVMVLALSKPASTSKSRQPSSQKISSTSTSLNSPPSSPSNMSRSKNNKTSRNKSQKYLPWTSPKCKTSTTLWTCIKLTLSKAQKRPK